MQARTGMVVGSVVGVCAAIALFVVWPAGPAPDAPAPLELAAGGTAGDGGLTGDSTEVVVANEQFGWTAEAPAPAGVPVPAETAQEIGPEPVPADADPVGKQKTMEWLIEEPELPSAPQEIQPMPTNPEPQAAPEVAPVAPAVVEEAAPAAPAAPSTGAPAGDPMVEAFARVALITFDLADAYGPAIEAAKAAGNDGMLRDELARETRIAIEEEFQWGFDAYVTFAQEVRRNPALETDVARAMARLRP